MSKGLKALITLALLAGFGAALYFSLQEQPLQVPGVAQPRAVAMTELSGVIAVDVEPYFKDSRVQEVLAAHGLALKVVRIGSRDMARKVVAGASPDFLFPSGVVAANQVIDAARRANIPATQVSPFHTPLVIASWEPIARMLVANGLAAPLQPKVYGVDVGKLTATMLAKKRWKDLKEAAAYDVARSVLVSTTDVRRSNSAAMYLALTSHALHGDVVTDRGTARDVAKELAGLFKRQGYQENYVNGNFDDYVSIGMGKTPMAFIYEHQLVTYALARHGVRPEMVVMVPRPTIINKVVFIATSERAKALGDLLATDPKLQGLAVEHGFRIADVDRFMQVVQPTGLALEPRITQVVDPPSFEVMAEMIDVVTREMAQ